MLLPCSDSALILMLVSLFDTQRSRMICKGDLVGLWPFTTETRTDDVSGNRHHGKSVNLTCTSGIGDITVEPNINQNSINFPLIGNSSNCFYTFIVNVVIEKDSELSTLFRKEFYHQFKKMTFIYYLQFSKHLAILIKESALFYATLFREPCALTSWCTIAITLDCNLRYEVWFNGIHSKGYAYPKPRSTLTTLLRCPTVHFKGQLSCYQLYNEVLTEEKIRERENRCVIEDYRKMVVPKKYLGKIFKPGFIERERQTRSLIECTRFCFLEKCLSLNFWQIVTGGLCQISRSKVEDFNDDDVVSGNMSQLYERKWDFKLDP